MNDLSAHLKTVTRVTIFFLSLCLLVWALYPSYRPYASGVMIGIIASLINGNYLAVKIRQLSRMASTGQQRRINLGFLTRAAIAVLAVMLSMRINDVNLFAVVTGLFAWQVAAFLTGILSIFKNK
jgi:ATP synthase protein I